MPRDYVTDWDYVGDEDLAPVLCSPATARQIKEARAQMDLLPALVPWFFRSCCFVCNRWGRTRDMTSLNGTPCHYACLDFHKAQTIRWDEARTEN